MGSFRTDPPRQCALSSRRNGETFSPCDLELPQTLNWQLLLVLQTSSREVGLALLNQDVTEDPTAEGQAALHLLCRVKRIELGLSTKQKAHYPRPGFSKEGEGARVSSRGEEGGPRGDQQNGGQARPARWSHVPCPLCASG